MEYRVNVCETPPQAVLRIRVRRTVDWLRNFEIKTSCRLSSTGNYPEDRDSVVFS